MSAILLQNEFLHYEVLGRGRPLLFLHGWIGTWRYWIPSMQSASPSYRAYAVDLWGFGDSAKVPERYSLDQQMKLIPSMLDHLGIAKIAIVGHGLGAIIGLIFTAEYEDRVDRFMAIGLPISWDSLNPRLYSTPPEELAAWTLDRNNGSLAVHEEASRVDLQAIHTSLDNLQNLAISKLIDRLSLPFLLLHGLNDPLIIPSSPHPRQDDLPDNMHQFIFEASGHFPMLDEPARFNRLVADFLSQAPGESPRILQLKDEWKRRVR